MYSHPEIQHGGDDTGNHVYIGILPFCGAYSMVPFMTYGIARGEKIVVLPSCEFNEAFLQAIEKYKVDICYEPPAESSFKLLFIVNLIEMMAHEYELSLGPMHPSPLNLQRLIEFGENAEWRVAITTPHRNLGADLSFRSLFTRENKKDYKNMRSSETKTKKGVGLTYNV